MKKLVKFLLSIIALVLVVGMIWYFVNEAQLNKYEIKFLDDYETIYDELMKDEIFEIEVKVTNGKGELIDKPVTYNYLKGDIIEEVEIIGNKATYQVKSYGHVRISVSLEEDSEIKSSIDLDIKKENVIEPTVTITDPNYFKESLKLGMKVYVEELPILINNKKDFSKVELFVATGSDEFIYLGYDSVRKLDYFEVVGVGFGTISLRSTHFNTDLLSIDYQTNFNNDEMYHILSLDKEVSLTADQITGYKEIEFKGGSLTDLDDLVHFSFLTKIVSLDSIIGNLDFSKLPMLETIEIYNNKRNGTDIIKVSLENMPKLKSFNFTNALIDELSIINETDAALNVNRLPITVKKLNISGYEFELLDLTKFGKLENLELSNVLDLEKIILNGDDIGLSMYLYNLPKLITIENILETELDALIIDKVDDLLRSIIDEDNNFIISNLKELSISNVGWAIDKLKFNSVDLKKLTLKNFIGKFSDLSLNLEKLDYLSLEKVNLDNLIVPTSVNELNIFNTGIKKVIINDNNKLNLKLMANQELEDIEVRNVLKIEDFVIIDNNSIKNFIVDDSGLNNLYKVSQFSDKLEKVQITKTLLKDIDFSIFNKAREIDVSYNSISEVRSFVNDSLTVFKLSNNLLTSTDTISEFPQLVTLYLDNNLINLVKFNGLINLETLHIENNKFYENESFNYIVFNDITSKLKEITLYTTIDISSKAIDNYLDYIKVLEQNKNLKVNGKPIHHVSQELIFQKDYNLSQLTFNYLGEVIYGSDFYFVYDKNEHPYINIKDDLIIRAVGIGEHTIKLQHKTDKELSYFLKYTIKFNEQALNDALDISINSYTKEELNSITELEFDQYETFRSLKELDYFEGLKKVTFSNGVIPNFDFTFNNNIQEVIIRNNTDENAVLIFVDNQRLSKINLEDANIRSFEIRYSGLEQVITELILPKTLYSLVISGVEIEELDLSDLEVGTVSLNNSTLKKISVKEQQEITNLIIENIIIEENVVGFNTLMITDFTSNNTDLNFFDLFDNEGNLLIKTLDSVKLINTTVENIYLLNSNLTKLLLDNTMTENLVVGKSLEELTVKNNNQLENLEIIETKLKQLRLSSLDNLKEVIAINNKDLSLIDFSNTFNALISVDISNNKLTILPEGINELYMPSLSELNISYNFIEGNVNSLNNLRKLTKLIVGDEKIIELAAYKKYIELKNKFAVGVVEIIEPIDILERVYVSNGDVLSDINYSEFTTYLIIQPRTNYTATIEANFIHLNEKDLKVEFNKVNLIGRNNNSAIVSNKDANLTLIGNNTEISLSGISNNIATINVKNLIMSGSFTVKGGDSLSSNLSGGTAIKANNITFKNATSIRVIGGKGFDGLTGALGAKGANGTNKDPNGKIGNQGGVGMAGTNGGVGLDISNTITVISSSVTVTGGTGGAGGRGGKGGEGGTGYSRPPQNIFNRGGDGGKGGKGGKGGNPGTGGLAFSNTTSKEISYSNGSTGGFGQGGLGGNRGRPGSGSLVTSDGNWGQPGDPGDPSNK